MDCAAKSLTFARTTRVLVMAGAAFLLIGSSAPVARAQARAMRDDERPRAPHEATRSPWDEDWSLAATAGLGAPTGLLGAEIERRLTSWWALSAGIGGTGSGFQGALTTHLHLPSNPIVSLGVGVSGGPYQPVDFSISLCFSDPCEEPAIPSWDLALWNNYELSFELRGKTGFLFRGFLGAAWLLNRDAFTCATCGDEVPDRPTVLPYLGFAVGRAFS